MQTADRLNHAKIEQYALVAVDGLLTHGRVFLDYEPGNMTNYTLTMTRIEAREPWEIVKPQLVAGCKNDGSYVMVGYLEHGCYPFEILPKYGSFPIDPGYIQQKLGLRFGGDAEAVAVLFARIMAIHAETKE